MATLTSYAELVTQVNAWCHRSDMSAQVPVFLLTVEETLNDILRVREMIVRDVIVAPSADEAYEQLPTDFLALHSIRFNTDPVVNPTPATAHFIEELRKRFMHAGGTPRHYCIVNNQILFERIPTGSPELEISSYVKIPALNATTQTSNGILERYPLLYLYGCLAEAHTFLDYDARLASFAGKFAAAIDTANGATKDAEQSPGPLIARPKRWF